ncbi:secretogranin_V domain-containing protein 7B2 [Megachile rotundata]|uniref:secretogranin_V domain-containing protein 7B2 n=1 Tax=Megachile rotundata TaxID=143995 RepID=UPI000258EAFE
MYWIPFLFVAAAVQASVYLPPPMKEDQLLPDTFLRELINQMGNDLVDAADSYLEYQDKPKEIPIELPADYDSIDTLNPNPSIRDQEYLRHSTLWSHQRLNENDKANGRQKIKPGSIKYIADEKAENALPAYCTPPNPCPVGYTSDNCIMDFENTAAFSRDYQSAQDCMCDTEHMLHCPVDSTNSNSLPSMHIQNSNFNQIVDQFQAEHNPFFRGEKLPIAAKKGLNVVY